MTETIDYQQLTVEAPPPGLEMLAAGSKTVIGPGHWAKFGTYLTVQTKLSVQNQSSTPARFNFRTDNSGYITVECPAASTVHVVSQWRAWMLYVTNRSDVDLIVWTGEDDK